MATTLQVKVNMKSSGDPEELTIGELAERFGLATHVLRHWEAVGLLDPARRVNGRRRYTGDHVTRVAAIQTGKAAGLTLEQVRTLLATPDGGARRALLEQQHAELERRIDEAQASKRMVEHALHCPVADITHCPEFQGLLAGVALR
jgi:MerR family copper efflux transcriptional regulator